MTRDYESFKPTTRFTSRVTNYNLYRPGYPAALLYYIEKEIGLNRNEIIADIGSGTGILTALLLKAGYPVTAIEPNDDMRQVAEEHLTSVPGFVSRKATAEKTGLPDHSVQLVTVAQAFHWMEPVATRKEFSRILMPDRPVALIWNIRLDSTPFMQSIEQLKLRFGTDYKMVSRADEQAVDAFFQPNAFRRIGFPNTQQLDFEALKGQILSSSYMPLENETGYDEMLRELSRLFERYQQNGLVDMEFESRLFYGTL